MAGEIIRQGDPTSHGGTVLEGLLSDICHGKPIAYLGHKVACPKCKGIFPIVEGALTTTFYGKGVALAGMRTACGAVLIATRFTDVVKMGPGGYGNSVKNATSAALSLNLAAHALADRAKKQGKSDTKKKVTRLFWSYGDEETPITGIFRFYADLHLHIETENYAAGDKVVIMIENDMGDDVCTDLKNLQVEATVGADGCAKVKNVFAGKTVDITGCA